MLAQDLALDLNVACFHPSTRVDLGCTELVGTVTWRENTWPMLGCSPGAFATGQAGVHARIGTKAGLCAAVFPNA